LSSACVLTATYYGVANHTSQLAGITAGILCDFLLRRENDKNTRKGNESGGKNERVKWRGDKGNERRIYETKDKCK
jgi:hypothetical protein